MNKPKTVIVTKVMVIPTLYTDKNAEAVKRGGELYEALNNLLNDGFRVTIVTSAVYEEIMYNTYILEKETVQKEEPDAEPHK